MSKKIRIRKTIQQNVELEFDTINETITHLQNLGANAIKSGYTCVFLEKDYGHDVSFYSLVGTRLETDDEYNTRIKNMRKSEKQQYRYRIKALELEAKKLGKKLVDI